MQLWNWRGIDVINAHERDPEIYKRGMEEGVAPPGRRASSTSTPLITHTFPLAEIDRPSPRRRAAGRVPQIRGAHGGRAGERAAAGVRGPRLDRRACGSQAVAEAGAGGGGGALRGGPRAPGGGRRRPIPEAARFADFDELLDRAGELGLDGVVIATPNALHAPQTLAALERGLAVFCQKPLALDAAEARQMVDAARAGRPPAGGRLLLPLHGRRPGAAAARRRRASSGGSSASSSSSTTPTDRTSPGASTRASRAAAP